MSKPASNDLDTRGYFLPEDSQSRLKKLRDHMQFLTGLAQPRTWQEEQERAPEVSVGHLAICLELLAEQADLVLQEVSWPARREAADASDRDVTTAVWPENSDTAVERFALSVTGEQIELLDRLVAMISAHGDVTAADPAAEPADHTVPPFGQAMHDGAMALRDLLDQVEAQRLGGHMPRRPPGVGEERAVYGTGLACLVSAPVLPMPDASPSRSVRLH